jgi:hypothetical protein
MPAASSMKLVVNAARTYDDGTVDCTSHMELVADVHERCKVGSFLIDYAIASLGHQREGGDARCDAIDVTISRVYHDG